MVDSEADQLAVRVEVEIDSRRHLSSLHTRSLGEVDVQGFRFRVVVKLHDDPFRKRRSKNALWNEDPVSHTGYRSGPRCGAVAPALADTTPGREFESFV